jgi:hypothetical protein
MRKYEVDTFGIGINGFAVVCCWNVTRLIADDVCQLGIANQRLLR